MWLVGSSIALAQVRTLAQETASAARPLTLREGEKIVSAAWEREQKTGRRPDCSHLVHEVYTLAGYPYPYADSFDLYVGTGSFVRVATPHFVPKDRVYVPRDVAVRILAQRLASLAQGSGVSDSDLSSRQQARIVHVLSTIFEERSISSLR